MDVPFRAEFTSNIMIAVVVMIITTQDFPNHIKNPSVPDSVLGIVALDNKKMVDIMTVT